VAFAAGCSGLGRELDPSCDTHDVRSARRGPSRARAGFASARSFSKAFGAPAGLPPRLAPRH
jgi:hypothetical protein